MVALAISLDFRPFWVLIMFGPINLWLIGLKHFGTLGIGRPEFKLCSSNIELFFFLEIHFICLFCFELKYQALNLSKNPIKAKSELS